MRKSAYVAKSLFDAQMKKVPDDHFRGLNELRESFQACESKLLRVRDKRMVEQEKLRTEQDEKPFCFHNGLLQVCRLVLDSTLGESMLEELVSQLQLLYENSWKAPVPTVPSSQGVEDDLCMRELKPQGAKKKIERMDAIAVVASSERDLDALNVLNAELDCKVTRFHS